MFGKRYSGNPNYTCLYFITKIDTLALPFLVIDAFIKYPLFFFVFGTFYILLRYLNFLSRNYF